MRVLNRETLKWEEVNIKGRDYCNYLYINSRLITAKNILAYDGKINTKGLGYCSYCNKIMTKREFEKHVDKKVSAARCSKCCYFNVKQRKTVKRGDSYIVKGVPYCTRSYNSCEIKPNMECDFYKCNGSFKQGKFIPILTPKIPSKILTVKAFTDSNKWELISTQSNYGYSPAKIRRVLFRHKTYANLVAVCDENGFLIHFEYRFKEYWWDDKLESLIPFDRFEKNLENVNIINAVRRLYNES